MELFVWRPWHTWAAKPNVRLGWVKRSPGRPLSWPVKTCSCSSPAGPQTWSLPKSLIHSTSKVFHLFLLSYSFFFSPIYSLLICPPTLAPFSPFFFHVVTLFLLLCFPYTFFPVPFFPYILPSSHDSFSYNEKWHIVKVLYFPTSSHTHSELGAKCSWCAASWTSRSATKLAPSHACTPGMHSHSTGFLSATSYVAGPLPFRHRTQQL